KEYNTGDIIGNDDLSILVTYNNNGTEIVNSGYNTSYDFSTPGTKTVTVSYGGKTTSYDVEVMSSGSDTTEIASFSISAKSGYSGSTVTVPVKLNASNVYDGNMTIQYDASKLSIENVQAVGALSDRQVTINKEYAADKIRVSFSGTTPINSNETILNLEFKALDNAQGTATISIAEAKAYNKSGGAIVTDTSDGSVQITAVADNVTVTNIQSVSQNGRKVVTANVSDDRVMCFLAAYQGGVLVECDSAHPSNGTFEVSVEESPNTQYKLMVWNMAMKPMMNAVSIY
ncbi:MAG: bacterial Ig-like domain-containing protein, partial [Clostridia bacterium]|nr:bacterial Ig-like domain-containing protein [Clostridia bacterium]